MDEKSPSTEIYGENVKKILKTKNKEVIQKQKNTVDKEKEDENSVQESVQESVERKEAHLEESIESEQDEDLRGRVEMKDSDERSRDESKELDKEVEVEEESLEDNMIVKDLEEESSVEVEKEDEVVKRVEVKGKVKENEYKRKLRSSNKSEETELEKERKNIRVVTLTGPFRREEKVDVKFTVGNKEKWFCGSLTRPNDDKSEWFVEFVDGEEDWIPVREIRRCIHKKQVRNGSIMHIDLVDKTRKKSRSHRKRAAERARLSQRRLRDLQKGLLQSRLTETQGLNELTVDEPLQFRILEDPIKLGITWNQNSLGSKTFEKVNSSRYANDKRKKKRRRRENNEKPSQGETGSLNEMIESKVKLVFERMSVSVKEEGKEFKDEILDELENRMKFNFEDILIEQLETRVCDRVVRRISSRTSKQV